MPTFVVIFVNFSFLRFLMKRNRKMSNFQCEPALKGNKREDEVEEAEEDGKMLTIR